MTYRTLLSWRESMKPAAAQTVSAPSRRGERCCFRFRATAYNLATDCVYHAHVENVAPSGFMFAGQYVGIALGGGGAMFVNGTLGFETALAGVARLLLLTLLFVVMFVSTIPGTTCRRTVQGLEPGHKMMSLCGDATAPSGTFLAVHPGCRHNVARSAGRSTSAWIRRRSRHPRRTIRSTCCSRDLDLTSSARPWSGC
jgi:hypothetical protein